MNLSETLHLRPEPQPAQDAAANLQMLAQLRRLRAAVEIKAICDAENIHREVAA